MTPSRQDIEVARSFRKAIDIVPMHTGCIPEPADHMTSPWHWMRVRRRNRSVERREYTKGRARERRALMRGRRAALRWAARVRAARFGEPWTPFDLHQIGGPRGVVTQVWVWRSGRTLRAHWPGDGITFRAPHADPNEIPF